jgi:riboflavin kinase
MEEMEGVYAVRAWGPLRLRGAVVEGFKRGSKLLGFPTANLDPASFEARVSDADVGVYFGFAQVSGGEVRPAVLSIGYNPTFKNTKMTVETYILHEFEDDFYGQEMRLLIAGYMRPQVGFDGFELLIQAIKRDVEVGREALASPAFAPLREDAFFREP